MTGDEIRKLRKSFGMTQEDFAHELGVTFATVNRWENGKAVPSRLALRVLREVRESGFHHGGGGGGSRRRSGD